MKFVRHALGVAAVVLLLATNAPPAPGAASRSIRFSVRDRSGALMTCARFRDMQSNGHADRGHNDALVDAARLTIVQLAPISCSSTRGATVELAVPRNGLALSTAWPSASGTSMIILDLDRVSSNGINAFEEVVASQSMIDLDVTDRAVGRPTRAPATRSSRSLDDHDPRRVRARARSAWRTWDAVSAAMLETLAAGGSRGEGTVHAVTFNSSSVNDAQWAAALRATGTGGWVRLVMDRDEQPDVHRPLVERAHSLGLRVLGQFLDSAQLASMDMTAWRTRVATYLRVLPDIDGWEVGNEVNGNWLGVGATTKAMEAARMVRACCPKARTMVTLLWNLAEDTIEDSTFTWLSRSGMRWDDVDDVGLSLYPGDHPLGTAFARVADTLHRALPMQHILVSELGYGNDDLANTWWWGSRTSVVAARATVARLYDAASRALPFTYGGTYWWYFLDEGDVRF